MKYTVRFNVSYRITIQLVSVHKWHQNVLFCDLCQIWLFCHYPVWNIKCEKVFTKCINKQNSPHISCIHSEQTQYTNILHSCPQVKWLITGENQQNLTHQKNFFFLLPTCALAITSLGFQKKKKVCYKPQSTANSTPTPQI